MRKQRQRRLKKSHVSIVGLLVAVAVAGANWLNHNPRLLSPATKVQADVYHVDKVYDGDTIHLTTGEKVRLIGIDAPESHENPKLDRDVASRHSSRKAQLALGREAAGYVNAFLYNKDVRLEFDVQPRDKYQRQLAYVYLMDGTFVNKKIICDGYAYPMTIPPNVKYADEFKACFDEAREKRRGLWQHSD